MKDLAEVAQRQTMIRRCDDYLSARTGSYELRCHRFAAVADMLAASGLDDDWLVVDVGADGTEFDYFLRHEHAWRGRYHPIDGGLDGVDLNEWVPARGADCFVILEVLEHLFDPERMMEGLERQAGRLVVATTPNPLTTDVFAMDSTHVTELHPERFTARGMHAFHGR